MADSDVWNNAETLEWLGLVEESYQHLLGKKLIDDQRQGIPLAKFLYNAEFVLLSHRFEDVPRFVFANLTAQKLWGYSWDEFIGMPSSQSAEEDEQEARNRLLEQSNRYGFIDNYQGVRVAKGGLRFKVMDVVLWNVQDKEGATIGQAAMFDKFSFI